MSEKRKWEKRGQRWFSFYASLLAFQPFDVDASWRMFYWMYNTLRRHSEVAQNMFSDLYMSASAIYCCKHFNFICIWAEAPLFPRNLLHWEARFYMHNKQYSQQNKILKYSTHWLLHKPTKITIPMDRHRRHKRTVVPYVKKCWVRRGYFVVVVVANTVVTSTTIRPQNFLPQTYLCDTAE